MNIAWRLKECKGNFLIVSEIVIKTILLNQEQIKRMNDINDLIKLIGSIDRRIFFCKSKDRVAYFRFKTKLFFVDDYTGEDV